jgi:hypothetical protein
MKAVLGVFFFAAAFFSQPALAGWCDIYDVNFDPPAQYFDTVVNGSSLDECHDQTFYVGDNYCNGLRAGNSGPNPVVINFVHYYTFEELLDDGSYMCDFCRHPPFEVGQWTFWCAL